MDDLLRSRNVLKGLPPRECCFNERTGECGVVCFTTQFFIFTLDKAKLRIIFSASDTGILVKRNSDRSRTYNLPITSSDALSLSCRTLVGAKTIIFIYSPGLTHAITSLLPRQNCRISFRTGSPTQHGEHASRSDLVEKRGTVGVRPRSVRPLRHMVPRLLLDEQLAPPNFWRPFAFNAISSIKAAATS